MLVPGKSGTTPLTAILAREACEVKCTREEACCESKNEGTFHSEDA